MVTLQEFGDVEENVLNPDLRSVPESVKQEADQPWCSGAPVRNRAERVQIENTLLPSYHPSIRLLWSRSEHVSNNPH